MNEHWHWAARTCRSQPPSCSGPGDNSLINFGIVTGLSHLAAALMLHLGHDPHEHPKAWLDLEMALGEGTLEIGQDVLTSHGLAVE